MPVFKKTAMHAPVVVNFMDGAAAGLQLAQHFFIADDYYEIVEIRANHNVNGGAGATVGVYKVTSGAISAGAATQLTDFALNTGAGTSQVRSNRAGTLSATKANRQLNPGDSLGALYAGTLTGLLGVGMAVILKRTRLTQPR